MEDYNGAASRGILLGEGRLLNRFSFEVQWNCLIDWNPPDQLLNHWSTLFRVYPSLETRTARDLVQAPPTYPNLSMVL